MIDEIKKRQQLIRNFSIIAHIDHGKSTLADRILEATNSVEKREMKDQILDSMDLERERGITIKLNAVTLNYLALDGKTYILHLIDTPGHVDFTYEVSRSLAACEGALLVVDAVQGVEAQTLGNAYLAIDNNLEIIPVINKIDLPAANPDRIKEEIENVVGIDAKDALLVSAKENIGTIDLLERIVKVIPAPTGDHNKPLQALIFDSYYDQFKGVVPSIRVVNGVLRKGDQIIFMATGFTCEVLEVGISKPKKENVDALYPGDVGWLAGTIKDINRIHVGDTITNKLVPCEQGLEGYRKLNSMVYCGFYPIDSTRYNDLREALDKLKLNDASLSYEQETSQALGFGFRCGFLGLLHLDVIEERIYREFDLDIIATAPSVIYQVRLTNKEILKLENPSKLPEKQYIECIEEPYVIATLMTPKEYLGVIMDLCQKKRGVFMNMEYMDQNRVKLEYDMPLSEVIYDFFDKLKSISRGYASLDYQLNGYKKSKLEKMDILLNGEVVDALSSIVHLDFAYYRGKAICEKLMRVIPRQMFEIPIQASFGNKVIARSTIKALRKDVLAKCYGGDISRKKKLLEKQKEGKKKMKSIGRVELPQEAFLAILSNDEE